MSTKYTSVYKQLHPDIFTDTDHALHTSLQAAVSSYLSLH